MPFQTLCIHATPIGYSLRKLRYSARHAGLNSYRRPVASIFAQHLFTLAATRRVGV